MITKYKVELINGCIVYFRSLGTIANILDFLKYITETKKQFSICQILGVKIVEKTPQDYFEID